MRQENIRKILNDTTIGDTMKQNSDNNNNKNKNKNKNEILKEEYYLPFIFEDYNINNKWIYLNKFGVSLCKETQVLENKDDIALENKEIVYNEDLTYKSFDEVLFENLEKSEGFSKINLQDIASKKIKIEKKSPEDGKPTGKKFEVKDVNVESYEDYNIYIMGEKKIFC